MVSLRIPLLTQRWVLFEYSSFDQFPKARRFTINAGSHAICFPPFYRVWPRLPWIRISPRFTSRRCSFCLRRSLPLKDVVSSVNLLQSFWLTRLTSIKRSIFWGESIGSFRSPSSFCHPIFAIKHLCENLFSETCGALSSLTSSRSKSRILRSSSEQIDRRTIKKIDFL